jgi:hypothetical protein
MRMEESQEHSDDDAIPANDVIRGQITVNKKWSY